MAKPTRKPVAERFGSKYTVDESGCWIWTGSRDRHGYGRLMMHRNGKWQPEPAYRVAHELFKGPIPKGYHVDHLCRVPSCVNPDHLEAVTPRENTVVRSSKSPMAQLARRTECKNGHPFIGIDKNGGRRCGICYPVPSRAIVAPIPEDRMPGVITR